MEIVLQPKQDIAFKTRATEVLYGGAKGGGKSFLLRASAIRWCAEIPGIQVYLFRRTLKDLRDNHLRGPKCLQSLLSEHIASGHVKYRQVENEFEFWNGSILHLCYCDSESDVENYQGAEMHVFMPDEVTHFTEYQYRYLRAQVRLAGLKVPGQYKGRLPRIEAGANPGSIGHAWVKRTWIQPQAPLTIWRAESEEGGMLRQFIPARLADNPYLSQDDPEYADRLRGMGNDSLVRAMLEGDWDLIAGQAFEKLRRQTHSVPVFEPPSHWLRFRAVDWGSTRPFSIGWWAVASETTHVKRAGGIIAEREVSDCIKIPQGALVRYREWYGWSGKPNEGLRMEPREVCQGIILRGRDEKYAYSVGDPSMWKVESGPSIAEMFVKNGVVLRAGDNSRHAGYIEVRTRIAGDEEGPRLLAMENCHAGFWRTMPDIVMDAHSYGPHSEDIDTDQEDHCADEVKYACMSRPWLRLVEKKERRPSRWLRFEEKEEQTWRTV